MEQILIALLVLMFICQLGAFWYIRLYLEDIHGHVFDEHADDRNNLFQSFVDGYLSEEDDEPTKKKKTKKDVK